MPIKRLTGETFRWMDLPRALFRSEKERACHVGVSLKQDIMWICWGKSGADKSDASSFALFAKAFSCTVESVPLCLLKEMEKMLG